MVIGDSSLRANKLIGIAKEYGYDKSQVDLVINYEDVKKYDFKRLEYSTKYSYVLVGPMAHKQKGLKQSSSMIAHMEENPAYPEIIRISNKRNNLKITSSGFKDALLEINEMN